MGREVTRDELEEAIARELLEEGRKMPRDPRDVAELAAAVADRLRLVDEVPIDPVDLGHLPRRYDLRAEQDYRYPGGRRKVRIRGGKPVRRDPRDVDAVVIHQTAVEYGVAEGQVRAAGGDRELALARRGLEVACHAIAFRAGIYVMAHELVVHVNHGNALNARSLGLEIDGRYAGLEDDPTTAAREDLRTTWRGRPTELTDRTVATARAALQALVDEGRELGMPIRHVYAHRQSSLQRRSDPGEAIWRRVVLDFAVLELGLEAHPLEVVKQGYPIPRQWDPTSPEAY